MPPRDPSRTDADRVEDVITALDFVAAFVDGVDAEQFLGDELRQSAVAFQFLVAGEAAGQVAQAVRDRQPGVPWRSLRRFRDVLAHGYWKLTWGEVWKAATEEAPAIRTAVQEVLDAEPFEVEEE